MSILAKSKALGLSFVKFYSVVAMLVFLGVMFLGNSFEEISIPNTKQGIENNWLLFFFIRVGVFWWVAQYVSNKVKTLVELEKISKHKAKKDIRNYHLLFVSICCFFELINFGVLGNV